MNVSPFIGYFLLNNGPFFFLKIKDKITTISTKKINMIIYFENLIVRVYVLYILNKYIKFHVNKMLLIIRSINLFFIHNFRLQKFQI